MTPAEPVDEKTLTDLDQEIILALNEYRHAHGRGPTWSELRERLGLPPIVFNQRIFADWWEEHQRDFEAEHPFEQFCQEHPDLGQEAAAKRWRREGHKAWIVWQRRHDPLGSRLYLLKEAGYVSFTRKERSLDLGPRVRAWQQT